jgi:hypothetical protein
VSEKSHIDDMRAAIRGDLERARARRPSIFERPAAPAAIADDPEAAPERTPPPEPVAEQHPPPEPPPAAVAPPPPSDPERSVLDRLAFWRR